MSKEMICPFCGEKLTEYPVWGFGCGNTNCNKTDGVVGSEKLWQALIESQKDLADMKEQAEFNAIMRGKDDADEIFGLKEQIEICNKREYKLTEQIAILKQDLEIAREALKGTVSYYDHYADFDGETSWDGVAMIMRNDAAEALEQMNKRIRNEKKK